MGTTYDLRSTATGWNYVLLPIEQIYIQVNESPNNVLKFNNILKGSKYNFQPIVRSRSKNSPVQKKIAYKIDITIPLLYNDLSKMPSIENYFQSKQVYLVLYLSAGNISGVNEWRKFTFEDLYCSVNIVKGESSPILEFNFKGVQTKNIVTSWWATQP